MVDVSPAASPASVRDRILAAATRLFAAQGFDGTALQQIADEVGVTKQAVLHHFPSKDELRGAVLAGLLLRWNDVLPRLLVAATAGDLRFEALTHELVTFFADDPDRARLLLREILDRPEPMRRLLSEHVRPWVDVVAEFVRKGQRSGEIREGVDPEGYVLSVIQLAVNGVAVLDCLGVVLGGAPASRRGRFVAEMLRVARTSLFADVAPDARAARPPRAPAPKKTPPRALRGPKNERRRTRT
jgi:AcrR family transcriptional regulator